MKTTSHLAAVKAVVLASCGLFAASTQLNAQAASPSIPVGWLTAFPTVVQTGTKPTLTWDISYPSVVVTIQHQYLAFLVVRKSASCGFGAFS